MLDLLEQLVAIPSVYPNEQKLANFIAEYLESRGCDVVRIPTGDRDNLLVTIGDSESYLGFYSHLDTVAPADDYTVDPYKMILAGNVASGLGVSDSKGGMAAILQTIEYALENNYPVKVLFVVDQENISEGAYDVIASGLADDIGFLVFPETGHTLDYREKFSVVYGRNGRLVFDIEFGGNDSHESIVIASEFLHALKSFEAEVRAEGGNPAIIPDAIEADSRTGESCKLRCSVVTTAKFDQSIFEAWVNTYARKNSVDIRASLAKRKTPYLSSYETPRNHPFLKLVEKEVIKPNGVSPRYTPSVADENVFANALGVPVLTLGAIGGDGHSSKEWINIDSLQSVREIYKELVRLFYLQGFAKISVDQAV